MLAAVLNANQGPSNVVFLIFLGAGAFENQNTWILPPYGTL
jgi:hypothetical protein